jgi:regulator of sigma E protease
MELWEQFWEPLLKLVAAVGFSIIFHEFGHLLFMRIFKTKIERFSLGFPPRLFGFRLGETDYCVGAIPAGGYVKPSGNNFWEDVDPNDPEKDRYLVTKPAWQRILIYFAGPVFNIILAVFLATGILYHIGEIAEVTNIVGKVGLNSPAEKAGLRRGDRILFVNGQKIKDIEELADYIQHNPGQVLNLKIKRGGKIRDLAVTPELIGKRYIIGIEPDWQYREIKTLPVAFKEGIKGVTSFAGSQAKGYAQLAQGKLSFKEISGPVTIFRIVWEYAKKDWTLFLSMIATLNILLAIANLLPISPLDGGQILIAGIELVSRRRLNKNSQTTVFYVGIFLLAALMYLAINNDLNNVFNK